MFSQFQLGSVTLKSRADSAMLITQIFNHCIESMEELKNRINRLETDTQRLSQERINALKVRYNWCTAGIEGAGALDCFGCQLSQAEKK